MLKRSLNQKLEYLVIDPLLARDDMAHIDATIKIRNDGIYCIVMDDNSFTIRLQTDIGDNELWIYKDTINDENTITTEKIITLKENEIQSAAVQVIVNILK